MLRKRVPGVVVSFLTSTTRTWPDTSAPATTSPTKSGPIVYYLVCARRRSRPRWDRRLSGPVCVWCSEWCAVEHACCVPTRTRRRSRPRWDRRLSGPVCVWCSEWCAAEHAGGVPTRARRRSRLGRRHHQRYPHQVHRRRLEIPHRPRPQVDALSLIRSIKCGVSQQ